MSKESVEALQLEIERVALPHMHFVKGQSHKVRHKPVRAMNRRIDQFKDDKEMRAAMDAGEWFDIPVGEKIKILEVVIVEGRKWYSVLTGARTGWVNANAMIGQHRIDVGRLRSLREQINEAQGVA